MSVIRLDRPLVDEAMVLATLAGILLLTLASALAPAWIVPALIGGVLVYGALLGPRFVNRRARLRRALRAKYAERRRWGFYSRDREGPWLNVVTHPVAVWCDDAQGLHFYSEWLLIDDGVIVVNPGRSFLSGNVVHYDFDQSTAYAWDGCSPKVSIAWSAIAGTPDGPDCLISAWTLSSTIAEQRTLLWPVTHLASLVHDALYQYLGPSPLTKADADRLFHAQLIACGFPPALAAIYLSAVQHLGARDQSHVGPTRIEARYLSQPNRLQLTKLRHRMAPSSLNLSAIASANCL
ncbi:hypothetical protein ACTSKR_09975 [Chitinibacteraceae bacterium HSL-7]